MWTRNAANALDPDEALACVRRTEELPRQRDSPAAQVRRIVVDPGVPVSAIITPDGPPAEIVREERVRLVVCPHLLAEPVLQRGKFRGYITKERAISPKVRPWA